MKNILTLTLILFTSLSLADFQDAKKLYSEKNYSAAFKEFSILAKIGNIKSQHNIAVMLAHGQGTKKDLIKAYAWSSISDSLKDYKQLTNFIHNQLSKQQLLQAQKLHKQYNNKYAQENSKVILGPIVKKGAQNSGITIDWENSKSVAPNYPMKMLRKGMQGWTDMRFNIYPDGSVRDIEVIEDMPAGEFAKEAVKALENYRFVFVEDGKETKITEPFANSQRIEFKFQTSANPSGGLSPKQQLYLQNLITKAESGDVNAQYSYAQIYETFLHSKGKIDAKQINQWLFHAAQEGITDAQYRLGKNIYFGKACETEKQKGLDWIMHAAQYGNANAGFMAYQLLQNDKLINQSQQPASYWLEQSAQNGSQIAQLVYAKEVANAASPSEEHIKLAFNYLNNYANTSFKTIQWYQTNALLQDKINKHSKALSSIKSALKKAKKAGWDLTELNQQKLTIQQHKQLKKSRA